MKYLLIGFLSLGACKQKYTEVIEKDNTHVIQSSEDFEGRYYFDNGGIVELYNDYNNQITSVATTLVFPNSNNTLASFSFPSLSKQDLVDGKVTSSLLTMTGVQASNFVGNIQSNSQNGLQLSNSGTYRYQLTLEFVNGKMNVKLSIQQLSGVLYSEVHNNNVSAH
jgi:hypothetical protein